MKEEGIDKGFIQFVNSIFNFNNEKAAEFMCKELIKLNVESQTSNSKKTKIPDSEESFYNLLLKFIRVSTDKINYDSIDEFLSKFYKLNYSYIQQDQLNKSIIKTVILCSKKKKPYNSQSLVDLKQLINLFESYGGIIITAHAQVDKQGNMKPQDKLIFALFTERFVKIHSAICALKEIAHVRSNNNFKPDPQLISSIAKIVVFSAAHLNITTINGSFILNPILQDLAATSQGLENIKKRWKPMDELKKEAAELADKLWSESNEQLHDEMAKHIYEKIKQNHVELIKDTEGKFSTSKKFDELSHSEKLKKIKILAEKSLIGTIRMAIIPVAEKYNRVWGTKGIKRK